MKIPNFVRTISFFLILVPYLVIPVACTLCRSEINTPIINPGTRHSKMPIIPIIYFSPFVAVRLEFWNALFLIDTDSDEFIYRVFILEFLRFFCFQQVFHDRNGTHFRRTLYNRLFFLFVFEK